MDKIQQFKVKNQFIIYSDSGTTFQSYESPICKVFGQMGEQKLILYGNVWDYSNTTRKYFKAFINEETPFSYVDKQQFLREIEQNENIIIIPEVLKWIN